MQSEGDGRLSTRLGECFLGPHFPFQDSRLAQWIRRVISSFAHLGKIFLIELGSLLPGLPSEARGVVVVAKLDLSNTVNTLSGGDAFAIVASWVVGPVHAAVVKIRSIAISKSVECEHSPALKLGHQVVDNVLEGTGGDGIAEVYTDVGKRIVDLAAGRGGNSLKPSPSASSIHLCSSSATVVGEPTTRGPIPPSLILSARASAVHFSISGKRAA